MAKAAALTIDFTVAAETFLPRAENDRWQ